MGGREAFPLNFFFLFSLVMIFLYAAAGILLIFVWPPPEILPATNRIGLGIILVCYAVYRAYRVVIKLKSRKALNKAHD